MNHAETKMFVQRIHTVWHLRRDPDTAELNEWHRRMSDVELDRAQRALDRIIEGGDEHAPNLPRLMRELREPTVTPVAKPIAPADCPECEGTGFSALDDGGVIAYAPCHTCRPDRAPRSERAPSAPRSAMNFTVMDGADARHEWYRTGATGHYPGCTCDRCAGGKSTMGDAELRDRLRNIPPLWPPKPDAN